MKMCITLFYRRVTSMSNSCAHNIEKLILIKYYHATFKRKHKSFLSRSQNVCRAVILFRLSESRSGQRNKSTVGLKWTVQELQHWTDWNRTTNPNPLEIKDKAPWNSKCTIFPPLIWEKGGGDGGGGNFPSICRRLLSMKISLSSRPL